MKRALLKKAISKAKAKVKPNRRVMLLEPRSLKGMVTTIGYRLSGLPSAESLKGDLSQLKENLGGKAAGLSVMSKLGIPIPPAFTLGTSLCSLYLSKHRLPESVLKEMRQALSGLETKLNKVWGGTQRPLLVSVRSGARVSMPGMMDTILNLGLNDSTVESLAKSHPQQARFWWDCYRRLIQMFSEVVLGLEYAVFDDILSQAKIQAGVQLDSELSAEALAKICRDYLAAVEQGGKVFPQDPWQQLIMATEAVFRSWNSERAIHYRQIHQYPDHWGTAVTVQAMIFGNLNDESGTGVVFTRDPSTGERRLYGEYLLNAQGEDVVAGIRTPHSIEDLERQLPETMSALKKTLAKLESHFNDAQDVEFTIEDKKLFILQTRTAKRTARAALENAIQFVREKRIKPSEALDRIGFDQVRQLLHPTLKVTNEKPLARGLAASPGAASGKIAFDPESAVAMKNSGHKVILVRRETSPEDIMGMAAAEGILTATGGMTSHAAVVGRGMGKCCVVGCTDLDVDEKNNRAEVRGEVLKPGDWITLNGSTGDVYRGELPTQPMTWGASAETFFSWADEVARIPVYANADTPEQAQQALELGAQGIGLCRTEHMFFDKERIHKFRVMILSESNEERESASRALLDYQRDDFRGILKAMKGYPVTVRLLDPPLHEFLPSLEDQASMDQLARDLSITTSKLNQRIFHLHETNPMLGHRGCRLGVTFPEIYEMQVRALADAITFNLQEGSKSSLKIMIPLTMTSAELKFLLDRLKIVYETRVGEITGNDLKLEKLVHKQTRWGTMLELPRACLIAKEIAPLVDFVSFGTNDLTQTTLGISRDDAAKFIPIYLERGILANDPFESVDVTGVGRLIEMAVREGRQANSALDVGVCGEHGGDPSSIEFFSSLGFSSVSCSPYRVPIARLAVARCALDSQGVKRKKA